MPPLKLTPIDAPMLAAFRESFPPFEGKGYTTAMAAELVARAGTHPAIAHTLPERSASCRVLEKCGFTFAGDVIDPEDGPVWRWQR